MRRSAIGTETRVKTSEAAIFSRLLPKGPNGMQPAVSRFLLRLAFSAEDKARMRELALKNQDGALSKAERQELENYVKVGDLLTILKTKARVALKKASGS